MNNSIKLRFSTWQFFFFGPTFCKIFLGCRKILHCRRWWVKFLIHFSTKETKVHHLTYKDKSYVLSLCTTVNYWVTSLSRIPLPDEKMVLVLSLSIYSHFTGTKLPIRQTYTCQLSRLGCESQACQLKTSISRQLTLTIQLLTLGRKMQVFTTKTDTLSKKM